MSLYDFVKESNRIEGIHREPLEAEIVATAKFLARNVVVTSDLVDLVKVLQPNARPRFVKGLNVRVGSYIAPAGGPLIQRRLVSLLENKDRFRDAYIEEHNLPVNPISQKLGMSGECGCGAYAQPGELKFWKEIDPAFGERIERLQQEVLARGFTWAWDGRPPKGGFNPDQESLFAPLCGSGCMRSAVVKQEEEA